MAPRAALARRNHPRFATEPSGDLFRVADLIKQTYFGHGSVFAQHCSLASA